MELQDVMRTTGASRSFTGAPIDDATLYGLLDVARFAPSGGNAQGWGVIVVRDPERKQRLAAINKPHWNHYVAVREAGEQPFSTVSATSVDVETSSAHDRPNPLFDDIEAAGAVLVVTLDLSVVAAMDAELDRVAIVPGASVYPFCQNVLLAARNIGLGGVLTTFVARSEPEVKRLLDIPEATAVVALIALGTPEHQPTKLRRNPVESFATIDSHLGEALTA